MKERILVGLLSALLISCSSPQKSNDDAEMAMLALAVAASPRTSTTTSSPSSGGSSDVWGGSCSNNFCGDYYNWTSTQMVSDCSGGSNVYSSVTACVVTGPNYLGSCKIHLGYTMTSGFPASAYMQWRLSKPTFADSAAAQSYCNAVGGVYGP